MIVNENIVYFFCKKILKDSGVYVFAGEPPGGSDDLHRVELKKPEFLLKKGSKGSRKFDLIAFHKEVFLLIELKDSALKHEKDIVKLINTIEDNDWLKSLWDNLNERKLLGNGTIPNFTFSDFIANKKSLFQLCLGAGPSDYIPPINFIYFEVNNNYLNCRGNLVKNHALLDDLIERIKLIITNTS